MRRPGFESLRKRDIKIVHVYSNADFIVLVPNTMYAGSFMHPYENWQTLAVSATDEERGDALRHALSTSVAVDPQDFGSMDEFRKFMSPANSNAPYDDWIGDTIDKYGYESRTDMFRDMKLCHVVQIKEQLKFEPTRHVELEGWTGEGLSDAYTVYIDAGGSTINLGRELTRCIDRCVAELPG